MAAASTAAMEPVTPVAEPVYSVADVEAELDGAIYVALPAIVVSAAVEAAAVGAPVTSAVASDATVCPDGRLLMIEEASETGQTVVAIAANVVETKVSVAERAGQSVTVAAQDVMVTVDEEQMVNVV